MEQLVLLLALMLGALVMVPLGDRLGLPSPILVTMLGIVLAILPFIPDIEVNPDYILPLVLPPLLYAAVQRTSWRQFASNWKPIVMLAVALVFVTTAAVAAVANAIVPGLPIAAAVALGALVAPPDPVAVSAVAGSLNLPRRMVSILEGEGLFNDVTAIVLYDLAIAAAVSGHYSTGIGVRDFALSAVVAIGIGLVVGWIGTRLMRLLGDATLRVGMTLVLPFASYSIADHYSGSGVLAVLVTALYLAESGADADDIEGRLTGAAVWQVIDRLVTGVAFGLVGLELTQVLHTASGDLLEALGWGLAVTGVVIAVRLVWLVPAAWIARHTAFDRQAELPGGLRETIVMWWAGMRGVASVALALAIPLQTENGDPFPQRNVIIFIAFTVIMTTLVLQGLTLPWLIKVLGVSADTAVERDLERELAHAAFDAGRQRLQEVMDGEEIPDEMAELLMRRALELSVRISPDLADEERKDANSRRLERMRLFRRVQSEMLSAARQAVLAKRNQPGADPEVVDRVLHLLDRRSLR